VLLQHLTFVCPSREIVNVSAIPSYSIRCLLLSPAMRSNTRLVKQTKGPFGGWFVSRKARDIRDTANCSAVTVTGPAGNDQRHHGPTHYIRASAH
jgi:hypothetical protein